MILAIDVGNTNIVLGAIRDGAAQFSARIASDRNKTADQYALDIQGILTMHNVDPRDIEGGILSSVVPYLQTVIPQAVKMLIGIELMVVGPGMKTGLNIRMDDPTELGGDLVAAAVAALDRYPLPCVVVDMGTAMAIGVVDRSGCYVGGLICPGMALSSSSLAEEASQLHDISLEPPKRVIGRNTRDSMRSGILHGTAAMLDGLFLRIEEELGARVHVAVTGDGAADVVHLCRHPQVRLDEDLVMRGLWKIYCKNRDAG